MDRLFVRGTPLVRRALTGVLVVSLCVLPTVAVADESQDDRPILPEFSKPVAQLIVELDSPEYAVREAAMRLLTAYGSEAIAPLRDAALAGTPEVSVRSVSVLSMLYAEGTGTVVDRAERALDELAFSTNRSAAGRATIVLESNYLVRQERAAAEIVRLGGQVVRLRDEQPNRGIVINGGDPDADPNPISHVVIGSGWTGGVEGLKNVRRLTNLKALYVIDGAVDQKTLDELTVAMPNVKLQRRGRAYLGIGGSEHPQGCLVVTVKEGGPASKAGLQPGDVFTEFGGKPTTTFEGLIQEIGKHQPGDKIKASVLRNNEALALTIELSPWPAQ